MAQITYEDKDNALPSSNPRRLWRDVDANEVKDAVNANAATMDKIVRSATASGTNTYAASVTPAVSAYVNGEMFKIKFPSAPTGASTLNLNTVGAKKMYINPTTQVGNGHFPANSIMLAVYDTSLDGGTGGFLLINFAPNIIDEDDMSSDSDTKVPTQQSVKKYVDDHAGSGSTAFADITGDADDNASLVAYVGMGDFVTLTDAAPVVVDCLDIKEPKFYLETASNRTLSVSNLRGNNVLNAYSSKMYLIKKTTAADIIITLDSNFTNKDMSTDATVTAYTLSGANNSYFKLFAFVWGQASGAIVWWNLVAVSAAAQNLNRNAASVSTGLMTLNCNNAQEVAFEDTAAQTTAFEVAMTNWASAEQVKLVLYITGSVAVTMPDGTDGQPNVVMETIEEGVRWANATKIITLTGSTASPIILYFDRIAGDIFVLRSTLANYAS